MSSKELKLEARRKRKYTTVNIPWPLMDRIEKLIKDSNPGYASRTDFILDCVRRRLMELDYMK